MPAIQVARTDTFELQRQKINQIGDQIFNISQGGSDLSTGNLKLGNGTKAAPSLSFISETNLGIYRPALGVIGYVAGEKKLLNISTDNVSSYRDFVFKKDSLTTSGISISDPGQNYDVGSYEGISFFGGTGKGATFDAEVISFIGSVTNPGENYTSGSYSSVSLTGGSNISGNTSVNFNVDSISGNITNLGTGYIPDTYTNVPLTGGSGTGARADIQITGTVTLNGSITNNGTGYVANSYTGLTVYNNPAQTFTVTTVANGGTPPPNELYSIDGNVQGTFALTIGNTYRFDVSDASNAGHPLDFRDSQGNFLQIEDFVVIRKGIEGTAGAFVDFVIKPTATSGNLQYVCQNHSGMGAVVSVVTGTAGEYGTGATADVTVDANTTVTSFSFVSSGQDYKTGDVLELDPNDLGGGSGFEYTLSTPTYQGSVTSVTVTDSGQDYAKNDVLSASVSDLGGTGSGFQFLVTSDPGQIKDLQFLSRGTGYSVGDVLSLPSGVTGITGTLKGSVNGLTTTLSIASTTVTLSTTSGIIPGMEVSTDIASTGQLAAGTTVQSVINSTQITLSANPTTDGAATLSFISPGTLEEVVVSDASGINIGDSVTQTAGTGTLPSNVTVQNVNTATNTITLSVAPTLAGTATLSFSPQYGSPTTPFAFTISSINSVNSITVVDGGNGYEVGDTLTVNSTDLTKPIQLNVFVKPVQLVTFVETISASVFSVGDTVEYSTGISSVQEEVYAVNVSGGNLVSLLISGSGLSPTTSVNRAGSGTQYTADTITNSNKFFIDSGSGQQITPDLTLYSGNKYEFNLSDSSNSGHPFELSTFRDGRWAPSLITGVTSSLTLGTQITVSSTTGILEGMEVVVSSGVGSIPIGTTVVSVDSGTQLTLSASPTLGGSSTLSFAGTEYTGGVVKEGTSLTITVTDTTPTLYYYCGSHPNMGGDDNDEAVLTINTNNPKVFGSGLSVSVDDILSSNAIELKLLDGELVSSALTSQTCNFNTVTATTSVSTNSLISNTFEVNSISSAGNITVSSANTVFNSGNLKVSTTFTVEQSGNLTTSGTLKTTSLLNVNDKIRISDNNINSTTGNHLNLQPASGKFVTITSSSALVIPKGSTLERPDTASATNGAIRFNTTTGQYEGYNASSTSWSSLGGVRDIDGNTYILAELTAGANDNTLWFYNDNVNTLKLTPSFLDFRGVKKISSGKLGLPTFSLWTANTAVSVGQYLKYKNNLYEVTGAGTTASSGNEPTHTSGAQNNGTSQLTWSQTAVSELTFEEISEVRIGPNKDCPLIIGSELKLHDNRISTTVKDLIIEPNSGKQTIVLSNTHFRIPSGTTADRNTAPAGAGSIRFNTTISQFEGYSGTNWSSLGGVRDVDGNTYIIPETAPAANENILYFYNNNVNTLQLSETALDFTNIDTITTSGGNNLSIDTEIVTLNSNATTIDNSGSTSTFISTTKQYLDLGLSTGLNVDPVLRLDNQGDIYFNTTFGSGTFNGVKVFDGDLKEFELKDYKIKTSTFVLTKGGLEASNVVLYSSGASKGCKVTVVSKSSSGKRSMTEYSVIDNGTDIFHNEYASLNTSADQYTASFDFTASTEPRITLTLTNDHATADIINFTVLVQEIK